MGLSASQGRLLLLTARRSDLEFRAQQISQKRLILSQQLEEISMEYENATSNRQMSIMLYQTQSNNTSEQSYRTSNLTYKDLISGTVSTGGPGAALSGIQASDTVGTQYFDFSSNTAYRLTSIDGAIVVSDESEIPLIGIAENEETTTSGAEDITKTAGYAQVFKSTNTTIKEGFSDLRDSYSVVAPPPAEGAKATDLYNALNGAGSKSIKVDNQNGYVMCNDADGNAIYYKLSDGSKLTKTPTGTWEDATLYSSASSVPTSVTTTVATKSTNYMLQEGSDGVYTLYKLDDQGNKVGITNRYVIDESLKHGSTDANGSISGPNYLQDCLRNGKYLLQKGSVDLNTDEGYKWSNVSWDATVNISDSYYTADDDAAKAKYDRLQTQIQAQDKKLELELDNIETQRSAVTTEIESVEKVINDNIESTFNAFG